MLTRRIPRVRQHDVTDCGAACICSVARYFGVDAPIARIRQLAGTDQEGTSLRGMIRAAEALGVAARGVRAAAHALPSVPLPCIAHLRDKRGAMHFVVVYRVTDRVIVVMDPADGAVHRLRQAAFAERWTGILLLLARERTAPPVATDKSGTLSRFWRLASPHQRAMVEAMLGAIAYTILGLATAVFVQTVVDLVIPEGNRRLLDLLTLAMIILVAAQVYIRTVKDSLVLQTGQKLDAALLQGYFEHLLTLPQRFYDTMRVGEIVSRLNDAVKVRHFLNEVAVDLLVNTLVIVSSFALMLVYSWRLALLVGLSVPLYIVIYAASNRLNRRNQRRTMEAAADFEAHVVETVGAVRTIRALGLERHSALQAERRLVRLLRPIYAVGRTAVLSGSVGEFVTRISTIALLWFGTRLVLQDSLTAGELMSFYTLNGHLTMPVLAVIAANRQVQDALIAAERLFDILDLEREVDTGVVTLGRGSLGDIRFKDVHFRYGSRPPLFRGLDLSIPQGCITAVVGESGSGKSTLAALLQRIHLPESGRILFGEVDIRYIRRESLQQRVAVVPQEVVLFSGTLLDNLLPGETHPDLRRLQEVLGRVGLRDLEENLPGGLFTPVGERGYALSGGQRQRVAIARALYRNPEILVLDEATSGLDAESEALVHETMRRLAAEGGTVVLITHRLTSARTAEHILVIARGSLVEEGSHQTLLAHDGLYRRLWLVQTGGTTRYAMP